MLLQGEVAFFVVVVFRTDDALGRDVAVDCAVAKFTTVATTADSRLTRLVMVPLDDGGSLRELRVVANQGMHKEGDNEEEVP